MTKFSKLALGAAALMLVMALPAFSQIGGIQGTCTDQQGKPIAGGLIVLKRTDINATYKVKTNKKGHYVYYGLPLGGRFDVSLFDSQGKLLHTTSGVPAQPGDPTEVDFDMKKIAGPAGAAPPPPPVPEGMSKEQAEAYKKQQAQDAASKEKLNSINQLLAQNKQEGDAGQWDQAIQTMQQALTNSQGLKLTPKSLAILNTNLADDYRGAHQYDKAVAAYQQALTLDPDDPTVDAPIYINLGSALASSGHADEAVPDFDKAAQLDPTNAKTAYYNEGVIMYNQSKMDDAATAFDKAIQLDPTYADAYYYKGMALIGKASVDPKTGQTTLQPGTLEAFQKYLDLAPTGPNAQNAKLMIQQFGGKIQTTVKKH